MIREVRRWIESVLQQFTVDMGEVAVRSYMCVQTRVVSSCVASFGAKSVVKLEAIGPLHQSLSLFSFLIGS